MFIKGFTRSAIFMAILAPLTFNTVNAASVSYYLDQTNLSWSSLNDGTNFLTVTIDDEGVPGDINFTVQVLSPLSSIAGNNFGIQSFSFNTLLDPVPFYESAIIGLPSAWGANVAPPPNNEDGFGQFDVSVTVGGMQRLDTLTFSVSGVAADTINDYLQLSMSSSGQTPPQGSVYFAAHVSGFDDGNGNTSAYFGGLTPIPLPPALVLLLSALGGLTVFGKKSRKIC